MDAAYIAAIEKRLAWLRWTGTPGASTWKRDDPEGLALYIHVLAHGDTFFMNDPFCALVEHARTETPDSMVWDPTWLQAPTGWLYVQIPFPTPRLLVIDDRWPPELIAHVNDRGTEVTAVGWTTTDQGIQFCCFQDMQFRYEAVVARLRRQEGGQGTKHGTRPSGGA